MKKYLVNQDLQGVVVIAQTSYKPGDTIVDNENNFLISSAIANLLKLKRSPIAEQKEAVAKAPKSFKATEKTEDKGGG